MSAIEEIDGATRLSQSFVLAHPREAVWKLISDPEVIARCMPGMSLDGPPQGETVKGRMDVRIGPIGASFAGEGTLRQIAPEYRQIIEGRGGDRKSGSRASGRARSGAAGCTTWRASPCAKRAAATLPRSVSAARSLR